MSNPAFGASADATPGRSVTANSITNDTANATGTARFFRLVDRDETPVIQGLVGTSGFALNFNTLSFVAGASVSVSNLVFTMPEAA